MDSILHKILAASNVSEITDILEEINDSHDTGWKPVGDRFNNLATINIGTDPAAGLTERITNAIDATLEKEWLLHKSPANITSPRAAAEAWFKIPEGRLSKVDDIRSFTELARKIEVSLKESEKENNPTVVIRDHGLGIAGQDFAKTILSLNGSNKLYKLFLLGAYGQGGSTSLSFNNYTVIVSKPFFDAKGKPSKATDVFCTIVRINPGDIHKDKHEWFEYLVDNKTGLPIVLKATEEEFAAGTMVKHIAMELGKYKSAATQLTGSLWYLAHNYLFDTIIPFTIRDERKRLTKDKVELRTVSGNSRRLSQGENTEYQRTVPLTFRDGKVLINYWVLNTEGDDPANRIVQYTLKTQPIIITFNGQKQGYLPNTIIKNELKLPFLEGYIIVQIECDSLDNESKRQLFSSTRESLRDTNILGELRKLTIDTLNEDDELKKLDTNRKQRYLKKDENEASEKLRKRLANRINVFLKDVGAGKEVTSKSTGENTGAKKQEPIPVQDPPTFLTITTPEEKEVNPGKSFSIKFKTDAHPNYFSNPDAFLAISNPHSFCSYTGTANVLNGYGIAYFKVSETTAIDSTALLTLELRPPRQKSLSASLSIVAVAPPDAGDTSKKGKNSAPSINPRFVSETDALYKDDKWNYESVAKVSESATSVDIWVSAANKHLMRLVDKARKQSNSDAAVESVKNRYLEHIAFYAYMSQRQKEAAELMKSKDDESENISDAALARIKDADLKHACETVCGIINDLFEYVVISAEEQEIEV